MKGCQDLPNRLQRRSVRNEQMVEELVGGGDDGGADIAESERRNGYSRDGDDIEGESVMERNMVMSDEWRSNGEEREL
ncbi:hypothetical protein RYX36_004724 [Vicia faba]